MPADMQILRIVERTVLAVLFVVGAALCFAVEAPPAADSDPPFSAVDADADGLVGVEEALHGVLKEDRAEAIWRYFSRDENADGTLSPEEYAKTPETARRHLKSDYRAIDADQDGTVSKGEYVLFVDRRNPNGGAGESANKMHDLDLDGRISLLEFALSRNMEGYRESMLDVLDRDGDGKLTRAEAIDDRFAALKRFAEADFWRRDRNQDGVVDRAELRAEEISGIPDAVAEDCQKVVESFLSEWPQYDGNRDGSLSAAEWPMEVARNSLGECGNLPFPTWDADQDGRVSADECRRVVEISRGLKTRDGQPLRFSNGTVIDLTLLHRLDADRDGEISNEEFQAQFHQPHRRKELFLSIDQDGNGRVSRQEFVASRRFVKDVVMEFFARDANLDGKLSNVEVTTYDRGSNEAMGHLLIPLFDLDHDRALSLEEFQRTPLANPILDWSKRREDRDHNERLTWSEFWSDQNDIVGMDLSRSMFGRFDRDSDGALTAKDTTGVAGKVAFEPEIAGHFLQWNGLRPAAVRQVRAVAAARIRPAPIAMMRGVVAINQAPAQAASEITANLNTSEEFERFLDRAEQLVTAGRPDLAPVLWQRVLDNGLGVLAPQANGVSETRLHSFKSYRPLHEEAVRRIVAAGPEALRQYRLTADAEARALLAHVAPEERETALAEVLRRFFLSSVGDDAAFELGCRRLERREYAGATQCFDRIKQYPDTDIPPSEIDIRLAVALSRLGSVSEASKFLEEESGIDPNLATVLNADFVSLGEQPVAVSEGSDGWRMMYGNSSRTGVPSAVTGFNWRAPLAEQWEYQPEFEMKAPPSASTDGSRTAQAVINGRRVAILIDANNRVVRSTPTTADGGTITREELAARWNETHWRPAGGMLISGDRILIKSQRRIICCDAASGKVVWMGRKTAFPFDPETQEMLSLEAAGYRLADDSQSRPRSTTEVVLFADRIAQEMTVAGDLVLNLEGALDYGSKKAVPENQNDAIQQLFGGGGGARKPRLNWLTAYDVTTGKLRWSITAADVAESGGCFLAAPLPVGERLVVPIGDDSHIDLAMLDRLTGSTVWKVTLCDRMAGGDTQAPVGISEADGTLYVSTGAGAVFALDSAAGDVKWVVSYPRRLSKQAINAQVQFQMMRGGNAPSPAVNQAEFRENLAISLPNLVVFLATDFDYLFALDPRNGALKWEAPLAPFRGAEKTDYCVGVREGRLFLAGAGVVRRYELSSGRIEWEHELLGSCGRGLATATGLYFPERYQIRRFDPDTGEDLGVTDVLTPKQEPLGNLFSEGGRLFAVGAARISRIASPEADAGGGS